MCKNKEEKIKSAILKLRDEYVKSDRFPSVNSYWDINNGFCGEFAEEVIAMVGTDDSDSLSGVTQDSFTYENDNPYMYCGSYDWDIELLENILNIKPPANLTWEELKRIPFGDHYWIMFDDKFFDAECPEGVCSFFELPLFKAMLSEYCSKCN